MTKTFENDLQQLYLFVGERQRELGRYFSIVESETYDKTIEAFIDTFLDQIELTCNKENRVALLSRLIGLRDEQMVQALEKEGKDTLFITQAKEKAYLWVKDFYIKRHAELIAYIEQEWLLSAFYRRILRGVHEVGVAMSVWQSEWTEHIINTINPLLEIEYNKDSEAIAQMLHAKGLYDPDTFGNDGDRSYSVLEKVPNGYEAKAYASAFTQHVSQVKEALERMIDDLKELKDDDYHQKEAYIAYFQALYQAFGEEDRSALIGRWAEVDRKWMSVTSPLQIGHPLEYYEDHYKKAVALEWDVRLSNPESQGAQAAHERVHAMFVKLFDESGFNGLHVKENVLENLARVQLYIGRPALFYAAEFNGLFSAQVVPNDEVVTREFGKKIFAFSDNILDSLRAKPFLKIHHEVFGKAFMDNERELVFHQEKRWHQVYEVTTIGHELGHILWMDHDTEMMMNKSGVFKNIEEFKATTGGLVAFFLNEDTSLSEAVFADTIKRAVGLIGWMKTGEVEPYYCEGLIHLGGLFASGVLHFDNKLIIDMSEAKYELLKAWYQHTYKNLALHYLYKQDAKVFLNQFALKDGDFYQPIDEEIKRFVAYYWELHQAMGRDIDESVKRSDWL
ncbi:MAG: invasion protein CiaB [Sulfurospirillaceae bacterium]|nr:invasion protein CiaB [Sulfurospirillaceae bacterium]MDD2826985.1 invasion protein CiaB [Sulfurospirillaceae bacterium]